eukprot:scaffold4145_cov115-Isochrysis_galbana.AAC.21
MRPRPTKCQATGCSTAPRAARQPNLPMDRTRDEPAPLHALRCRDDDGPPTGRCVRCAVIATSTHRRGLAPATGRGRCDRPRGRPLPSAGPIRPKRPATRGPAPGQLSGRGPGPC